MVTALWVLTTFLPATGLPDEWSDFATLSKDKDPDKRCRAIELVKKDKTLKMVQALLPLLDDPHPRVRYRAMRAIGDVEDAAAVEFLVKTGLKAGKPLIRQHTAEALGWVKDESTQPALVAALEDPDAHVRAQAADALAWLKTKDSVDALLGAFERDKAWEGRAWALDAIGRLDPTRAAAAVEKAAADKAYQVRMQALMVAPKVSPESGLAIFKQLINDPDWRVRVQAIESALEVRHPECVGGIIDLFLKEKGRLRLDCWTALVNLTGKELGLDPKPWKSWWEANKDTFQPIPKTSGKNGKALPEGGGATKAEFFKMPILSNRVSFILDLSGSMKDPAPGSDTRKKETKLDGAKKGMTKTISDFTLEVWFNIICLGCDDNGTYRKEQKIWKKGLTPGNETNKRDATKYTSSQEARGYTNIWDGIEYAFEDPEVDTLFLYSDGGASRGIWTATWEILNALSKLNRYRKIMIFTVETPGSKANTEDNIRLLKELAGNTGGSYRLAETK